MQISSLTRLIQGIAIGAGATMFIGFYWAGWVTGSTASNVAQRDAKEAAIAALAPICVAKFNSNADVEANLATLKKISSWQQASFIEQGGWATMPGTATPDIGVAQACAELLGSQKVASKN